jgi:catalase
LLFSFLLLVSFGCKRPQVLLPCLIFFTSGSLCFIPVLFTSQALQKRIQLRQTALFFKADPDYGSRVAKGLGLDVKEVERIASMTHEERAKATEK